MSCRTNNTPGIEARLDRIESLLGAPAAAIQTLLPGQSKTWAKVAAKGMRQGGAPEALLPPRHTVRVQMAQAKGLSNDEILKEVKKTISGPATIRVLHSGDINVTVSDESSKDRAQGLPRQSNSRSLKKGLSH